MRLFKRGLVTLLSVYAILVIGIQFLELAHLYHGHTQWQEMPRRPFEDISIETADGETINLWFMAGDDACYVCLLCHGNGGNNSYRTHQIQLLHERGYAVAIFDYRGYGKSSGFPTEKFRDNGDEVDGGIK